MIGTNDQKFFTVKDIAAADFIAAYALHLKKTNKIAVPEWTKFVTNGAAKELAPYDEDWVYTRVAAVARKIYLRGNIGVSTLRHIFGGKQTNKGNIPEKHRQSAGKIIRWSLQALEKLDVLKKDKKSILKKNSRILTKQGQTDLNRIATQVAQAKKEQQ